LEHIEALTGSPLIAFPQSRLSNRVVMVMPNVVLRTVLGRGEDYTTTDFYITRAQRESFMASHFTISFPHSRNSCAAGMRGCKYEGALVFSFGTVNFRIMTSARSSKTYCELIADSTPATSELAIHKTVQQAISKSWPSLPQHNPAPDPKLFKEMITELLHTQSGKYARQLEKQDSNIKASLAQSTATITAGIRENLACTQGNQSLLHNVLESQEALSGRFGEGLSSLSQESQQNSEKLLTTLRNLFTTPLVSNIATATQGGEWARSTPPPPPLAHEGLGRVLGGGSYSGGRGGGGRGGGRGGYMTGLVGGLNTDAMTHEELSAMVQEQHERSLKRGRSPPHGNGGWNRTPGSY
jgi:hypothetical protein